MGGVDRQLGVFGFYRIYGRTYSQQRSWMSRNRPLSIEMFAPRLMHATDRAQKLSHSYSLLSDTRGTMSYTMWMQARDGDVEGLTRALDEEGRDPAAEAERSPTVGG